MRVSRRHVVLTAFAGAAAAIGGAYHWRRLRRPNVGDIVALLEDRLAHLDLDPAGLRRFADGTFLEAGWVAFEGWPPVPVPLADLERFG